MPTPKKLLLINLLTELGYPPIDNETTDSNGIINNGNNGSSGTISKPINNTISPNMTSGTISSSRYTSDNSSIGINNASNTNSNTTSVIPSAGSLLGLGSLSTTTANGNTKAFPPSTTSSSFASSPFTPLSIHVTDTHVSIADVSINRYNPKNPELVPSVVFYDMPSHILILKSLIYDFLLHEHVLLMGVQGVGKNKLADRLLQLLRREREYIQLHRDSTVQSLTLSPSLHNGVVVW